MTSDEASDSAHKAVEDLTQQLGRTPRPSELAQHMRNRLDEVIEAVAEHREPRAHEDPPPPAQQPNQAEGVDNTEFRDRVARSLAREIATHRRAIEAHQTAVTKLTDSGDVDGAEAARIRLTNARKRLNEALDQERLLLRQGYAAMAQGPAQIAHAVPAHRPAAVCGVEAADMVGVAEDFASLPQSRKCPNCVQAINLSPET